MRILSRAAGLLAVLIATILVAAQEESAAARSSLTEQVTVRVIEYSLLARNAQGEGLRTLAADQLRARSKSGQPVRIVSLEASFTPAPAVAKGKVTILLGGRPSESSSVDSAGGRAYLIFLDTMNDLPKDADRLREAIDAFLDNELRQGDLAALISYGGRLSLDAGFTTDIKQVDNALEKIFEKKRVRSGGSRSIASRLVRGVEECAEQGLQLAATPGFGAGSGGGVPDMPDPGFATEGQIPFNLECLGGRAAAAAQESKRDFQQYLNALTGVVEYAGGCPDPVTVIAISHGSGFDASAPFMEAMRFVHGDTGSVAQAEAQLGLVSFEEDMLRGFLQKVAGLGVVLHFVDPSSPATGRLNLRRRGSYRTGSNPISVVYKSGQQTLALISRETGGTFDAQKDLFKSMQQAKQADNGRYIVSVTVENLGPGEPVPEIEFTTSLDDVSLHLGRGIDRLHADKPTRTGATSPSENNKVYAKLFLRPGEKSEKERYSTAYTIGVNPAALEYSVDDKKMRANLAVTITLMDPQGNPRGRYYRVLGHSFPRAAWEAQNRGLVGLQGSIRAPAGRYEVLVEIRNTDNDQGGTISETLALGP